MRIDRTCTASHDRTICLTLIGTVFAIVLPMNTTTCHSSDPVEIDRRTGGGKMRVWLRAPDGLFNGHGSSAARSKASVPAM